MAARCSWVAWILRCREEKEEQKEDSPTKV